MTLQPQALDLAAYLLKRELPTTSGVYSHPIALILRSTQLLANH